MRSTRVAWLTLAFAFSAACTHGSTACGAFRTSLSVEDRTSQAATVFDRNEPIAFELEIANTRNAPATLTASSSCTAVVFEITDSAQRRRWGSADGIACIQMLRPRTYAPLETVSESATWDQKDSGGEGVPPGSYVVTASVGQYVSGAEGMLDCRAELSRSASFSIR